MNIRNLSILILLLTANIVIAQDINRADRYLSIRNYDAALSIYEEAITKGKGTPGIYFKAGVCYAKKADVNAQLNGLPYLQRAIDNMNDEVAPEVYYYAALLYHRDQQVDRAIKYMTTYKSSLPASERELIKEVERHIEVFNNALVHLRQARSFNVKRFRDPINSEGTEYNPVVSADERLMAFTALRKDPSKPGSSADLIEQILVTNKTGTDQWSEPQVVNIRTQYNVGTAGITPDGNQMLIFIGDGTAGDIYTIQNQGDTWSDPVSIGSHVNTRYLETTASISPDGKRIYFASNQPGGEGGLDIYMVEKDGSGKWSAPQNLGPNINTSFDDDAPFIHPDGKTLFFTSEGHNTMGGKDIFKAVLTKNGWQKAINMGYPINTTVNDNYFNLTADGRKAFFSSDRKGGAGGQDLYYFDMPEELANVPLTLIKGKILAGEEQKPVPTKIKVVDNESSEKIDYVYDPNPATGNYLIIFPPGKDYDMIIEAEGYKPYTMNISIPNQTYFYELYQQIYLYPVKQFDEVVGQEVSVKNAFYDTSEDPAAIQKANDAMLIQSDSVDLYELMDAVISSEDTAAYSYLLELMYEVNPIEDVNFNENDAVEAAETTYYFDENEELEMRIVDGDTIYSLPTFYVTEEARKQKAAASAPRTKSYEASLLNKTVKVYFETAQSDFDASYNDKLKEIFEALSAYEDLAIEISGYASSTGDAEYNRQLSNKRANAVLEYFSSQGISRRRILARGYGATQGEAGDSEESRRVEIKLIDIDDVN